MLLEIPNKLNDRVNRIKKELMISKNAIAKISIKEYCDKILGDERYERRNAKKVSKTES